MKHDYLLARYCSKKVKKGVGGVRGEGVRGVEGEGGVGVVSFFSISD